MLKKLEPWRIQAHPYDYLVVQGDRSTEMQTISYSLVGQFRSKHYAEMFAKLITCYHVSIIAPAYERASTEERA